MFNVVIVVAGQGSAAAHSDPSLNFHCAEWHLVTDNCTPSGFL